MRSSFGNPLVISLVAYLCGCGGQTPENDSQGTAAAGGTGGATTSAGGSSSIAAGAGGKVATAGSTSTGGSGGTSSGGASSAGGAEGGAGANAGSGGSAPHVVGNCDALGEVGKWEEITADVLTFGSSTAVAVDPLNSGTVYLGTGDYNVHDGLLKSTDCGSTWIKVNTGSGGADLDTGAQWALLVDFQNPENVFTTAGYGANGIYKSTNAGIDWVDVRPTSDGVPGFTGNLQMAPDDPTHIFTTWHAPCGKYEDQIGCFSESTDAGVTWTTHYGDPAWGSEVRIYPLTGSRWIVPNDGILLTTDSGESWDKVSDNTAGGHSAGQLYRAADGAYYIGTFNGILRSAPEAEGTSWSLVPSSGSAIKGMTGDGTTMYATGTAGYYSSPEDDGLTWTLMPDSPTHNDGCFTDFDRDHHVLYASCGYQSGFFRLVTQ